MSSFETSSPIIQSSPNNSVGTQNSQNDQSVVQQRYGFFHLKHHFFEFDWVRPGSFEVKQSEQTSLLEMDSMVQYTQ